MVTDCENTFDRRRPFQPESPRALFRCAINSCQGIEHESNLGPGCISPLVTAIALSLTLVPAAVCLKGAFIGGAAGLDRHEANRHAQQGAQQQRSNDRGHHEGYGAPVHSPKTGTIPR